MPADPQRLAQDATLKADYGCGLCEWERRPLGSRNAELVRVKQCPSCRLGSIREDIASVEGVGYANVDLLLAAHLDALAAGEGLAQGYTMDTPQTRRWDRRTIEQNDFEEGRRLFVGQTSSDQGRSRRHVATCETPEQAREIVAIVGALRELMANNILAMEDDKEALRAKLAAAVEQARREER